MTPRIFLAAAFSLTAPAFALTIVPAQPSAFDPVSAHLTGDSCTFAPSTVHGGLASNTFRITQQPNNCLVAGTPETASRSGTRCKAADGSPRRAGPRRFAARAALLHQLLRPAPGDGRGRGPGLEF